MFTLMEIPEHIKYYETKNMKVIIQIMNVTTKQQRKKTTTPDYKANVF